MTDKKTNSVIRNITENRNALTPKERVLANFTTQNPRKAVFMTTKELSEACGVSEATVVRFVAHLGYEGYADFQQALRDFVETGMTLRDRTDLPGVKGPGAGRFHRIVLDEMNNLKMLCETADLTKLEYFVKALRENTAVYVVGSRLSYTLAYYLGWSLTKVRKGIRILEGSDSTAVDWLANAPDQSLVVVIAVSRYPNELIKLSKVARRLGHTLYVIADSKLCPLIPFAHFSLVVPSKSIPLIGNPSAILCIANYLVLELAGLENDKVDSHQGKLEQVYLENDILFNLHDTVNEE